MAELVNEAAAAIWEVDPERPVVGPPTAPWGDWTEYSAALYPRLDPRIGFAANLYPRGRIIDNLRQQLAAAARIAGRRAIWITETNVSRHEVTARVQARYVREIYRQARRRGISGLIFQRLWSPFRAGDGLGAWDAGLSALSADASPTAPLRPDREPAPRLPRPRCAALGVGAGRRPGAPGADPRRLHDPALPGVARSPERAPLATIPRRHGRPEEANVLAAARQAPRDAHARRSRGSTSARAATARACRIASARSAAPTPGAR